MLLQIPKQLLVILIWLSPSIAQNPDTIWTKTFGGAQQDVGRSIALVQDGGYIIAANTGSLDGDNSSVYVIRINEDGELVWQDHWVIEGYSFARSITRTMDGCYVITGQAGYGGFYGHPFLLKIDQNGNEIWHRVYEEGMCGNSVIENSSGNFLIVGGHLGNLADCIIIFADAGGNELWHRIHDIDLNEYGEDVLQHPDSGYIITGCTGAGSGDGWDIFILKTDELGEQEWMKRYGFQGANCDDYPGTIESTSDGGYVIGATTYSIDNTYADFWLLKTDSQCDTIWTSIIGGQYDEIGRAAIQTYDGRYVIIGFSYTFGPGGKDVYVVKTNAFGDILWSEAIGGYYSDRGWDLIENKDYELVVVGQTDSFGAGSKDVYVIKLPPDQVDVGDDLYTLPLACKLSQNYPNPFNASTIIKYELPHQSLVTIEVYDILGRRVSNIHDGLQPEGYHQVIWDAEDISSGIYFYKLQAGNYIETKKMMLIK